VENVQRPSDWLECVYLEQRSIEFDEERTRRMNREVIRTYHLMWLFVRKRSEKEKF
jgi:hypothetical protein